MKYILLVALIGCSSANAQPYLTGSQCFRDPVFMISNYTIPPMEHCAVPNEPPPTLPCLITEDFVAPHGKTPAVGAMILPPTIGVRDPGDTETPPLVGLPIPFVIDQDGKPSPIVVAAVAVDTITMIGISPGDRVFTPTPELVVDILVEQVLCE